MSRTIGIDISQIIYNTGVSVYTKNLVKNLIHIDHENKYILYGGTIRQRKKMLNIVNSIVDNPTINISPISPSIADLLWNRFHIIPIERFIGSIDIFHSSDWSEPPTRAKKITTVHDVTPLKYPEFTNPYIVSVHQRKLNWVKKEAQAIIVPSIATKLDLIDFGFRDDRITVIPEAADDLIPISTEDSRNALSEYRLPEKYILVVGLQERKNVSRIIKAFQKINKDEQIGLVCVGSGILPDGNLKNVHVLGQVSDRVLISLYMNAQLLVYVPIYEGFGLPVLQAFSLGCPVVSSNTSSLPEVTGDAAVLVDPMNVDSIYKGICKAIIDRVSLIKLGKIQSRKFSWSKTAESTLKVYNNL